MSETLQLQQIRRALGRRGYKLSRTSHCSICKPGEPPRYHVLDNRNIIVESFVGNGYDHSGDLADVQAWLAGVPPLPRAPARRGLRLIWSASAASGSNPSPGDHKGSDE